jgi:hypothetical protein
MKRVQRALQNAALAVAVFIGFVVAGIVVVQPIDAWQMFVAAVSVAVLFGAPAMFVAALLFDLIASRLGNPRFQRALAVGLLLCGSAAFALAFDDYLAPHDDRAVLGWLILPPALVYGSLVRLPAGGPVRAKPPTVPAR